MTVLEFTRTSPTYPAPVLVDGRAQPRADWVPTGPPVRELWGSLRVEIGATWELDPEIESPDNKMVKTSAGVDYTEYRGVRTLIESLSWADPFGEEDGQITLPAVTPWDVIASGAGWGGIIKPGVNIDIWRVLPAWLAATTGKTEVGFWHGIVLDPGITDGDGAADGATYQLMGAMVAEMSTRAHQPQPLDDARDIATVLAAAVDTRDSYSRPSQGWRFDLEVTDTNIDVRMRGSSGQMVIDFVREVLAVARNGGHWWTITQAYDADGFVQPRKYVLRDVAEPIASTTIRGGMPGWEFSPRSDVTQDPNAVYGAGQRPDGGTWQGMVYPLLHEGTTPTYPGPLALDDTGDDVTALQMRLRLSGWPDVSPTGTFDADTVTGLNAMYKSAGHAQTGEIASEDDWDLAFSAGTGTTDLSSAYRRPLAVDPRVERWEYAADGTITGENTTTRDASILRVDADLSYPDRTTRGRASTNASRIVADFIDGPLVSGEGTLTLDPPDLSRLDLRVCGELVVDYTASGETPGSRAIAMRIQRRELQPEVDTFPLSMTLSTRPYPALDLKARIERNRAAAENPARSFFAQLHRANKPWRDANGWDAESGAGIVRSLHCAAGEWTVTKFIGAQYGSIQALKADASIPTRYAMALFGDTVVGTSADYDPEHPCPIVEDLVELPLTEAPTTAGWWAEVSEADQEDAAFIDSWGTYGDSCGYHPYSEGDDPTPSTTGKTRDYQPFNIASLKPPWLWLAIWSEDEADYDVTMRVQTAMD